MGWPRLSATSVERQAAERRRHGMAVRPHAPFGRASGRPPGTWRPKRVAALLMRSAAASVASIAPTTLGLRRHALACGQRHSHRAGERGFSVRPSWGFRAVSRERGRAVAAMSCSALSFCQSYTGSNRANSALAAATAPCTTWISPLSISAAGSVRLLYTSAQTAGVSSTTTSAGRRAASSVGAKSASPWRTCRAKAWSFPKRSPRTWSVVAERAALMRTP